MDKLPFRHTFSQAVDKIHRFHQQTHYAQQSIQVPEQTNRNRNRGFKNNSTNSTSNTSHIFSDYHHTGHPLRTTNSNNRKCLKSSVKSERVLQSQRSTIDMFDDDDEIIFTENKIYVGIRTDILQEHTHYLKENHCDASTDQIQSRSLKMDTIPAYNNWCAKDTDNIINQHNVYDNQGDFNERQLSGFVNISTGSTSKRLSEYDNVNKLFWHSHDSDSVITEHFYADAQNIVNWALVPVPSTANNNLIKNVNEIHYDVSSSVSRRTSISTNETWIDDEEFDNSFNEELELRCAKYCVRCY